MFDFLIVGAGFAGSVLAERLATQMNARVLVVEKRDHIGGDAYDYIDLAGVLVHKDGPQIFRRNSLEFTFETQHRPRYQQVGTIDYPNDHAFTRLTEFEHLTGQEHDRTTIVYEFPRADGDPYYPVPRPENQARYKGYQELAEGPPNVHFVGRLATLSLLQLGSNCGAGADPIQAACCPPVARLGRDRDRDRNC